MKSPSFILLASLSASLFLSCLPTDKSGRELNIVPFPKSVVLEEGKSNCAAALVVSARLPEQAKMKMLNYLTAVSMLEREATGNEKKNRLNLTLLENPSPGDESYTLTVSRNAIDLTAASEAGLFYGIQTLRQLWESNGYYPLVRIKDEPRFSYRGLHLDVSRHFYSKEFIKKQLDKMAAYKLNTLHWHLTDGAGWRLEIDRYPKLTEIAAWRPFPNWKAWADGGAKYCTQDTPGAQGGFYTKEDVREILAYAEARHITVIPEIELPSHSEEVLAVYPELSCTGQPYKHSDFCVGNEQTFEFLQNVFDEVIELFPSEMIHIGGDEAPKTAWRTCPKCAARMAENNLKDVEELQSYMIRRIGAYLNSKGKTFIGWDEILEGGLAENAIVMSWRGEEGGISAVKSGHEAIMTPGAFCYFDAYQHDPATQPAAIGGYLPVEKVYGYNPVPDSLNQEERKLIRGVQANLWTEYIPTESHAEYMIYPRLLALAEVAWSAPEQKSWEDFKPRLNRQIASLRNEGYNVCPLNNEVGFEFTPDTANQCMVVTLKTDLHPATIYYTLDGSEPNPRTVPYKEPFAINQETEVNAVVYHDGTRVSDPTRKVVSYPLSIGKRVTYNCKISDQYPAGGESALVNGLIGGFGYGDGRWQGFLEDMDVTVDLEKVSEIRTIKARFMQIIGPWVWMPASVEILVSEDGNHFSSIYQEKNPVPMDQDGVIFRDFGFKGKTKARYVRYIARLSKGFMFTDELVIE
ncbi:MAG: family 20 glycosylhydrolase [Bacteroidales bacterium]